LLTANQQYSVTADKDGGVTVTLSIPAKVQGVGLALFLAEGAGLNPILITPTLIAEASFEYDVNTGTSRLHPFYIACFYFDFLRPRK